MALIHVWVKTLPTSNMILTNQGDSGAAFLISASLAPLAALRSSSGRPTVAWRVGSLMTGLGTTPPYYMGGPATSDRGVSWANWPTPVSAGEPDSVAPRIDVLDELLDNGSRHP